jgi:hypothetical protein
MSWDGHTTEPGHLLEDERETRKTNSKDMWRFVYLLN